MALPCGCHGSAMRVSCGCHAVPVLPCMTRGLSLPARARTPPVPGRHAPLGRRGACLPCLSSSAGSGEEGEGLACWRMGQAPAPR